MNANDLDTKFIKNLLTKYYDKYDDGDSDCEYWIAKVINDIFYDIFGYYIYEELK